MSNELKAIVIGGVLPALLYGVTGILQKMSSEADGGAGMYLVGMGMGTTVVGTVLHLVLSEPPFSLRPVTLALIAGLTFSLGAGLVSVALIRYGAAISQLTPVYNTNVLVTVVLGLVLFAEYRDVNVARLLGGTLLLVSGAVLVASA